MNYWITYTIVVYIIYKNFINVMSNPNYQRTTFSSFIGLIYYYQLKTSIILPICNSYYS